MDVKVEKGLGFVFEDNDAGTATLLNCVANAIRDLSFGSKVSFIGREGVSRRPGKIGQGDAFEGIGDFCVQCGGDSQEQVGEYRGSLNLRRIYINGTPGYIRKVIDRTQTFWESLPSQQRGNISFCV